MIYARVKAPTEEIRPCVCTAKTEKNGSGYYGMPALTPYRNSYTGKLPKPKLYWKIECPRCGRGGIAEHKSVNAALRDWNKMQDELWSGPEAFNIPIFYPYEDVEECEQLYKRYHELLQEIGYGYLLESLTAEEKKPLMQETRLKEKIELMEGVLKQKREREAEFSREWKDIDVMAGGYEE